MHVRFLLEQGADGLELRDHGRVALGEHRHPFEVLARLRGKAPRVIDRGQQLEAVLEASQVVILPVAWRRVHEASAALGRDVVTADHYLALARIERVRVLGALDLRPLESSEFHERRPFGELIEPLCERIHQTGGDDEPVGQARVAHDGVLELAVHRHRQVGRDRPRRRRPDRHAQLGPTIGSKRLECRRRLRHCEPDVNRARRVLLGVLELRLGECRARRG